jgi:transcriptional regulator GlxA family with amidase domain
MRTNRHLAAVLVALASLLASGWGLAATPGLSASSAGPITVAVVITDMANVIDFSGPWEVFQDTARPGTEEPAFRLYTVSDSRRPVHLTGGLTIVPDYTFDDAPAPAVIVVGAQRGSARMLRWLQAVGKAQSTEVLMSVCTGAFKLADAGLLDGLHATTHHDFFDAFARKYPKVVLDRGARFVQSAPHVFTAGGTTSGIDLALHVVSLYFGQDAAAATARYMEHRASAS